MQRRQKELRGLETELDAAKEQLAAVISQAVRGASAEKRVRHELLGLRGDLRNVAIVIDASHSMKNGGRWQDATSLMKQWVECLDMQTCVLIVFHNHVTRRPKMGVFDFVNNRDSAIAEIRDFLKRVEPKGQTNTLKALEEAYKMPGIDTIILFTDGSPNLDGKAASDPVLIDAIYELCVSKKEIPINAIGIGDYFRPELSKFLLTLAKNTGGTFIGR
jgi:Mg-chelatase subunit ChlD